MNEQFFYTTETPHRWSSGPVFNIFNDDGEYISSLEEAKELAERHQSGKWGQEDFVRTTYGVHYESEK